MGGMNRIRVIAVVLSMVLLLLGASGNTNDETRNKADSYESESQEETKAQPAGLIIAEAGETYIEEIRQAEAEAARIAEAEAAEAARIAEEAARIAEIEAAGADMEYVEALEEEREAEAMARRVVQVSEEDYTALIKLVEAEASGEDIKGRMLVANVVINRLEAGRFGSSIKEVIYQRVDGRAQFSPVGTGKIERVKVSEKTVEAVERALCGEDESQGALYFAARAYADPGNMAWFDRNLTRLFSYHGHEFFI
jgi:spore germination cell wall hydrolase CwlJ-like protein